MLPNSPQTARRRGSLHGAKRLLAGALVLTAAGCTQPPPPPAAAPVTAAPPTAPALAPLAAVGPGEPETLLHAYVDRAPQTREQWQAEACQWVLPGKTKRLDAALFIGVAQADDAALDTVLAPHATWGLPDPRMVGARPVADADGRAKFLTALRRAALRFPRKPTSQPFPALAGIESVIATGAEPVWSVLRRDAEAGRPDDYIIIRKMVFQGRAVIDYVGFWPEGPPPAGTQWTANLGAPPPLMPPCDLTALPEGISPAAIQQFCSARAG
jgi:hypothetical protein